MNDLFSGASTGAVPLAERLRPRSIDDVVGQRLEHVHGGARQERAVHLERRVLGRRADERQQALLDKRQERVLLRLVEAMYLVDEQDRRASVLLTYHLGARHGVANVL